MRTGEIEISLDRPAVLNAARDVPVELEGAAKQSEALQLKHRCRGATTAKYTCALPPLYVGAATARPAPPHHQRG